MSAVLFSKEEHRARDFKPATDDWLGMVDEAWSKDRAAREVTLLADARRRVTNWRLDGACAARGDDLWLAVRKDRSNARW